MCKNRMTQQQLTGKDEEGTGIMYCGVIYRQWPGGSKDGITKLRGTKYSWSRNEPRTSHFL
jgi:hypothetical protein